MPSLNIFTRSDDGSSVPSTETAETLSSPTILAGIIVAAVIFLGIAVWLGLRVYRKRARNRREAKMGAAFLSVKGIVRDNAKDQ